MFIVLPILWLILWLVIGGVVGALSGMSPQHGGLYLFLLIFLGGCFGLPVVGGLGWWIRARIRGRH